MPRGPKPKPTDLSALVAERETLDPPPWLLPCAKPYWDRLVTDLPNLHPLDWLALADWALCWARLVQVERQLTREGLLIAGYRGNRVKHPAVAVAREYRDQVMLYAKVFKATPRKRSP